MEQTRNCGNNGFDMYNIGDRCEYVQWSIRIALRRKGMPSPNE